jgi:hypothetical protein
MSDNLTYLPSQILPGDTDLLRNRSFTRWLSRDLRQAAVDFCKNIGLFPIYCEFSPDGLTRYLFWNPPRTTYVEIRSGRTLEQFIAFDQKNAEPDRRLLSLHVSENHIYSAVWISADQYETAASILAAYGITPAQRVAAE